jgi:hypothetical protein
MLLFCYNKKWAGRKPERVGENYKLNSI